MFSSKWFLAAASLAALLQQARAEDDVGLQVANYLFMLVLVMLSALFSGLTLGLLGLDTNQLRVRVLRKRLAHYPHLLLYRS